MFSFFNFLTYAVVTAVTPGPNNLMSMSIARQSGFKQALPFNFGVFFGFSVVMLICTFFFTMLSSMLPMIKTPMVIIGALYMLFLAYKTYQSSSEIKESLTKSSFVSGFLLQFINPKIYLYCLISMEVYILPYFSHDFPMLVFFSGVLSLIGFSFTLCWAFFGALLQTLFSKHARLTNTILALLLVYCAASLFFE
ncbi:LysE family transporter [Acetobacterium wieringae]|uniref:LysE family transporter n=1 Tax=Acetobacterium wieringae TaxID=52694 RepID=UPI002033D6A8|nr:LysE family transporter [Acetobacterium wieringae]MEA4806682.1 LysE family transporter [Acetobacterium wieringae]URN84307.1 LysE family transporter [Acetobacterium wieringae]